MSLIDMARECLESQGVRTRCIPPMKIAEMSLQPSGMRVSGGLHTTSDFANVLSGTINTTLRAAYEQAPATFRAWARRTTATLTPAILACSLASENDIFGPRSRAAFNSLESMKSGIGFVSTASSNAPDTTLPDCAG